MHRQMVARGWGPVGMGSYCLRRTVLCFEGAEDALEPDRRVAAQHCECTLMPVNCAL